MSNFGSTYAELYDLFHENKDYNKEVDDLLQILDNPEKNSTILDFGCGSGKHAVALSNKGYKVDGFDISLEMIAFAKKRTTNVAFEYLFENLASNYEIAYSLFDVMSYQISVSQLTHYFHQISNVVLPGGIVVVDSWHQTGVRLAPPGRTSRSVVWQNRTIERLVEPEISSIQDVYELKITLRDIEKKSVIASELHMLRAWSLSEVQKVITKTGFKLLSTFVPNHPGKKLEKADWRFGVVMRKLN